MAYRTTAFDAADALGWDMAELARRSGVPVMTLYSIRRGHRGVGPKAMKGLMRAFPHLSFERLFVPTENAIAQKTDAIAEPDREVVAA